MLILQELPLASLKEYPLVAALLGVFIWYVRSTAAATKENNATMAAAMTAQSADNKAAIGQLAQTVTALTEELKVQGAQIAYLFGLRKDPTEGSQLPLKF